MQDTNNTIDTAANEEAKTLVERLLSLKAEVGEIEGAILTDAAFVRRFTGDFAISTGTWSRLRAGDYNGGKLYGKADDMRKAIASIEARLPQIKAAAEHRKTFLPTALVKAVDSRVRAARDDPYGRRIVVCLAPSGYGKTAIVKHYETLGAVCVEGMQSWKSSYRCFCASVANAAGSKVPNSAKEERAENMMLEALSTADRTVVIDEANTLSGQCANGIKEIVNRTGCTVLLLAIPEFWDKFLQGNEGEVHQVVNRCQRVIRQAKVRADDVRLFLEARGVDAAFAPKIADAANVFGGFRTVIQILNEVEAHPTLANVQEAISRHDKNLEAFRIAKR